MRMLKDGKVATRIPVQDLQRARTFYAEKLGLEPSEERPGGLLYRCGGNIATMSATHRPTPVVGLDWRQVWPCAMLPLPHYDACQSWEGKHATSREPQSAYRR